MSGPAPAQVPVCPAGAEATANLLATWGAATRPSTGWLAAREERVRQLRTAGRLAEAERYGWLSLAALGCGMTPRDAIALGPAAASMDAAAGPADVLPRPLMEPPAVVAAVVPGTTLETFDVRDDPGWELARAVLAPPGPVLSYRSRDYVTSVFAAGVRVRLATAMEVTGG